MNSLGIALAEKGSVRFLGSLSVFSESYEALLLCEFSPVAFSSAQVGSLLRVNTAVLYNMMLTKCADQ